jgi:hypothetical protein
VLTLTTGKPRLALAARSSARRVGRSSIERQAGRNDPYALLVWQTTSGAQGTPWGAAGPPKVDGQAQGPCLGEGPGRASVAASLITVVGTTHNKSSP